MPVKTQMPYALTVAAMSVLSGTLLTSLGVPAGFALLIGVAVMAVIVRLAGKNRSYIQPRALFVYRHGLFLLMIA